MDAEENSDCDSDCFRTAKSGFTQRAATFEEGGEEPAAAVSGHEKTPKNSGFSAFSGAYEYWHPLGDSNPCSQTENLMC